MADITKISNRKIKTSTYQTTSKNPIKLLKNTTATPRNKGAPPYNLNYLDTNLN